MIKYMKIALPTELHWVFKNKCKFYDMTPKEVIAYLIVEFNKGRFDEEFQIPVK